MDTILIRTLQLIMSLSLLVIIHEGGHFMFARLFKIRVEKFCMFFDPWFTLFKFKPKKSETEYAIGWLPLGGYVKIAGMIDESMDTEQMAQPAQPWEFRSKPAWQRLFVMIGGVLFNLLLAFFIYAMILFSWGDSYVSLQDMTYGMEFNEHAEKIGFRDGDILLRADGELLDRMDGDMFRSVIEAEVVTVLRDGAEKDIYIPELSMLEVMKESPRFIDVMLPCVIDSVLPEAPFAQAGISKGDRLISLNGEEITSWGDFVHKLGISSEVAKVKGEPAASLSVVYEREGVYDTLNVVTDSLYKVGCMPRMLDYKVTKVSYGFFSSFPAGVELGVNTLKGYVSDMKYVFTKEGAQSLGGFGTIASIFPKVWDWQRFWYMTAFLSIALAFMNILPIPALDGGHVLFLLYEIIARRKPSDKFMGYAEMAGLFILLALMIWANLNDILRIFF